MIFRSPLQRDMSQEDSSQLLSFQITCGCEKTRTARSVTQAATMKMLGRRFDIESRKVPVSLVGSIDS